MSEKKPAKVIDLNARRAAKKPKGVRCLTILQDDTQAKRRKIPFRFATPEEYEKHPNWSVGIFHRGTPRAPDDKP